MDGNWSRTSAQACQTPSGEAPCPPKVTSAGTGVGGWGGVKSSPHNAWPIGDGSCFSVSKLLRHTQVRRSFFFFSTGMPFIDTRVSDLHPRWAFPTPQRHHRVSHLSLRWHPGCVVWTWGAILFMVKSIDLVYSGLTSWGHSPPITAGVGGGGGSTWCRSQNHSLIWLAGGCLLRDDIWQCHTGSVRVKA